MLKKEKLDELKNNYHANKFNKIRHRMLNKVSLVDLITDTDTQIDSEFNINIKTHGVTDQKASGRCWAFAGLNILREKVIENCNLENIELSGSYVAFYDKLERFNILLERLISYKNEGKDLYDRYVSNILEKGVTDGGYFSQFAALVNKYGIVPNSIFPETYSSSNTYEINQILSRLIRKFYLELSECDDSVENIKNKYLDDAYLVIANVYGIPSEKFNFEYTDKKGEYHIDKNITPKEFYDKYIGIDLLNNYVEVTCYNDEKYNYNNVYEVEETSRISGIKDNVTLNIAPTEFENLILKQLKKDEIVYFYCSTTSKRVDGIWMDIMDRYGEIFDIDLTLERNDILKTNGVTNCHCMLITGANTVNNKVKKWKIENSWGSKCGKNGYYVATNDWLSKYVHMIVINKEILETKHHEILQQEPIKIQKWDEKC